MIKQLEVQGFKSFDKKISIPLSKGLTAIVGPNGSGKSNICDSICFVLGITSARSLRAERLTHLIYNGGKKRNPANYLEVSLVLDNSNKEFPFEEDTIRVTRRLTRKGTMTYKLNGKRCTRSQLIDVLSSSMFSADGHNIVLQGDVTNFIEMSPLERRQVIDDICGIAEYDEKKDKAKKDLDIVESRIKELVIVMSEKKKYLDNLKKEKDDAEKYQALKDELKMTEARLAFSKLTQIKSEEKKISDKISEAEKEEQEFEKELKEINSLLNKNESSIKEIDKKIIKEGGREQINVKNELERLQSRISINESKIDSKRAEISSIDSMLSRLQAMSGEKSSLILSQLKEKFDGVYGNISELFTVDLKYKTAIEAALGPRANFIVTNNEDTAIECIEFLKKNKIGRATFLPLNKIKGPNPMMMRGKGVVGLALNLIEFKPEFRNIFKYSFGDTHIVTDLKTTKGFIKKIRMVSLDGDVAEKSGAMRGGFKKRVKGVSTEIDECVRSRDKLLDEIGELQLENESLSKTLKQTEEKAKKLGLDFQALEKNRDSLEVEIEKLRAKRDSISEELDTIKRKVGELRVDKARIDAKLTDVQLDAKKFKKENLKPGDIANLEKKLTEIASALVRLEPVNMKAIEIYDETYKEYKDFDDKFSKLQDERKSVLNFIDEIETKKKDVFFKAFDKISEEFQNIFPKLSPNGEARLYLEDKEEPLTGGLFVEAKPAGKKLLGLDAMSGGEKVLTALSFLFALQRYKPAPFYILDEVDAALDPKNSLRFVDLLQETLKNAQILLISHNNAVVKKSDRIFGVSMTEDGVSKVVGLDLKELEKRQDNGTKH